MTFNQEQHDEVIRRRHKIVMDYCKKKGWSSNPSEISIEQLMEIRELQEWKDVPENVSENKQENENREVGSAYWANYVKYKSGGLN